MSDFLRYRVMEWPLPADEMAMALVMARLADDLTRATMAMRLCDLASVLDMPERRLALLMDRLEARGVIDRVTRGDAAVFILAATMPKARR